MNRGIPGHTLDVVTIALSVPVPVRPPVAALMSLGHKHFANIKERKADPLPDFDRCRVVAYAETNHSISIHFNPPLALESAFESIRLHVSEAVLFLVNLSICEYNGMMHPYRQRVNWLFLIDFCQ